MTIQDFLNKQLPERKTALASIHKIITETNPGIKSKIGGMMGKEMIMYETGDVFTYALSSVKTHISLHNMVLYSLPAIREKYIKMFGNAKFQRGCINFKKADEIPMDVMKKFMTDCAKGVPEYLKMYRERMQKKK